jgi:DNA-binding LytR/AlgR family response regulator
MKLRCIVIDDEYPARVLLKDYIDNLPQLDLINSFKNPLEAMETLSSENTDLIFLDIQMPGLTGIEFLKSMRRIKPMVIFTTAYPDYALEGYTLDVVDYLLKPFTFERFVAAVQKASDFHNLRKGKPGNVTSEEIKKSGPNFMQIKSGPKKYLVNIEDILYVEGLREYVTYVLESQKIISLESLRSLEQSLPADLFLRVHKSFIINKKKVQSIEGNQIEIKGRKIPIGKSYKEIVMKKIFQ